MPEDFADQVNAFDPSQGLAIDDGAIDEAAGTIKGVSIATAGVEAIGHGELDDDGEYREFWTDGDTLESMLQACLSVGQPIKAKLEHGTGLAEIVGTFDNFRIDGDNLRADFTAMQTSARREHLFTLAKTISKQFGVSVTAMLRRVKAGAKDLMRCASIRSIDFVDDPAINAQLFSRKSRLDKRAALAEKRIQKPNTTMEDDIKAEVKEIIEEMMKPVTDQLAEIKGKMEGGDEMAEKAEAAEKEMADTKEEMSALKGQVTELSQKVEAAKKESEQLGTKFVASLSKPEPEPEPETFEAAMSAKTKDGKPAHLAFNELCTERPDFVKAEAQKQGKQVWQLATV